MMLDDSAGTLDTFGKHTDPYKVYDEVGCCRQKKCIIIVTMPSLPEFGCWAKEFVPVPANDVKDDDWYLSIDDSVSFYNFVI